MIPASILTGFLGSGKTTILAQLLRDPALSDTAVIINEFGDIGLDHDLIESSDESLVTLQTGCLCCQLRGDLIETLHDLLARRADGSITPFARIVIETSGLSDPAPILQSLMVDDVLAEHMQIARVVTVVDGVHGAATLQRQMEARKQVAVADQLVISKCDVAQETQTLAEAVKRLNPTSTLQTIAKGRLDCSVLSRPRRKPTS